MFFSWFYFVYAVNRAPVIFLLFTSPALPGKFPFAHPFVRDRICSSPQNLSKTIFIFKAQIKKPGIPGFFTVLLLYYRLNVLAQYCNRNVHNNVSVQRNGNRVVTNSFQRALRHADLSLFDREALLGQCFGNVKIGNRTE
jgi:hypothetical protein